ncbi:crotonobetainyl-CoA:carnitine CoA-transferase CaiB-like acyl-CoA transferase [Nocardioides ginsengisegetis]|uniref:Crotonobetainyl-CoA:carnitine CoA-transferase CaiB-like acyl-CoA transferase n=1 Tax=Nocardioides ginsengisegetis TaxID=661491 RepID=A0A7W3IZ36_9ACTN|nr:CoA transferase [Nocardioides ginsengisegetis]MBA8803266.1 crotonobetainyl-CoA:carnitine CoA-transferase CaiB-like acyl-CoA transferase [Nocardioides ginsengisegetis]
MKSLREREGRHTSRPLEGLRVIDFTQMLAGPYCSMLFADLGADVVKVEPPTGDIIRTAGPFHAGHEDTELGGYFMSVNRNKRGFVVDLKTPDGIAAVMDLVGTADIVLENFRSGVMDRFGLSYERMRGRNPQLVYGAVRGFGDPRFGETPYDDWPAFDIVAQAMGGVQWMTGEADGPPQKVGVGIGDILPGAHLAIGVLAAVVRARESGVGEFVEVSMLDSVLSMTERIVHQYSYAGEVPIRQGNTHPYFEPFGAYETSDGWIALAATTEKFWAELTLAIGRADLSAAYPSNSARTENAATVRAAISAWAGTVTTAEALKLLGGRVPIGRVNSAADIFQDPYFKARGMLVELIDPGSGLSAVVAGCPVKFLESPDATYFAAPQLGGND